MVALFVLLMRSQLRVDPVQPRSRASPGIEGDRIRIQSSFICSSESCLNHRDIGDSVLNHRVLQHVVDRVVWGRVPSEHWTYV